MTTRSPHRLALYRAAVQHPQAEAQFLHRAYWHCFPDADSHGRLREDFAGTAAVAAAWVELDDNHRALAVEKHGPTARWAQRQTARQLGDRAQDLHIVEADVMDLASPKVDIVAALNFSTFIYHDRDALRRYFRHARRCLRRHGMLVIDAFGGPGAMRPGTQRRQVPTSASAMPTFIYEWEQRAFDPVTARIDCRIHFDLPGPPPRRIADAFIYHWRLWTLPELRELMLEAGFTTADVWSQRTRKDGTPEAHFHPTLTMPPHEDWLAYLIATR